MRRGVRKIFFKGIKGIAGHNYLITGVFADTGAGLVPVCFQPKKFDNLAVKRRNGTDTIRGWQLICKTVLNSRWRRPLGCRGGRAPCPRWCAGSWWGPRCSSSRSRRAGTSWCRRRECRTAPTGTWRSWPPGERPSPRLAPRRPAVKINEVNEISRWQYAKKVDI